MRQELGYAIWIICFIKFQTDQKLNKQLDPVKLEPKQSNTVAFVVW